MKKILVFCLLAFIFWSCADEEKEVQENAYAYLNAMANYQVSEAAHYATDKTCETTLKVAEKLLTLVDSSYIASDTPATIDINEVLFTSDSTAEVKYTKNTPIKKNITGVLQMVKCGNKWLAHVTLHKKRSEF